MDKIKTALVSGAGRGIGRYIAIGLARNGYLVTISSRTYEELEETKTLIEKEGGKALIKTIDIQNSREVDSLFALHRESFGSQPDVAVNAAAIQGSIGYTWEVDPELWKATVNIDLVGAYNFACSAVRAMIEQKRGNIVLFSGGGAAYARPMFSAYGAAKTAVLRLVETMFVELSDAGYPGITVNAIAPGAVKSRMTDEVLKAGKYAGNKALEEAEQTLRDGGTPPDKALDLILFLANQKLSGCISGRLIHVNEPYLEYGKKAKNINSSESGLLRRKPYR